MGKIIKWVFIGIFCAWVFAVFFVNPNAWPPLWLERHEQRQQILERIQSAGGWDALRKDCVSLANKCKGEEFDRWDGNDTNSLPAAVTALKSRMVEFFPPKMSRFNDSDFPIIRITMFGAHATGGHDIPWLGLDVLCEQNESTNSYNPIRNRSTTPFRNWEYRKVTDGVYEFY